MKKYLAVALAFVFSFFGMAQTFAAESISIGTGATQVTATDFMSDNAGWVEKIKGLAAELFSLFLSFLLTAWNLILLLLGEFKEYIVVALIVSAIYWRITGKIPFAGLFGRKKSI